MNPDQKVEEITMNFEDKTSLFNDQYFCKVLSLKYADGIVEIGFKVTGDNSLGPLQNPTSSKLFVNDVDYSTFAHEYSQQNPFSTYEGVLRYQVGSNLLGEVEFKFGNSGYSFGAHLHLEMMHKGQLVDPYETITGQRNVTHPVSGYTFSNENLIM